MQWLNSGGFDGGKRDFLEKCAREKERFPCLPCRDPLETGKLITLIGTIQKAAEKSVEEMRERMMLDWLGTRTTPANARQIVDSFKKPFERPAVPKNPVLREDKGRFFCDSCGENFSSLPIGQQHLASHLNDASESQLRVGTGGEWRDNAWRDGARTAPQFDLNSPPSAGTQLPAAGTQQTWRPVDRSTGASDELRKGAANTSDGYVATRRYVATRWPRLSTFQRGQVVRHAARLCDDGVPGPEIAAGLAKFVFLNFGI